MSQRCLLFRIHHFITEICDVKEAPLEVPPCPEQPWHSGNSFKTPRHHFPELKDPFHPWFDLPYAVWCSRCDRVSVPSFGASLASCCGVLEVMWSVLLTLCFFLIYFFMWCLFLTLAVPMHRLRLIMSYPPSHHLLQHLLLLPCNAVSFF